MGLLDAVLKLVKKVVEAVMSEITKQVNRVQNEVLGEMTKMVTSGFDDVWRGEDADQFKEKILKMAVPQAEGIIGIVTHTNSGLQKAMDLIDNADKKVNQIVSDLASEYAKI